MTAIDAAPIVAERQEIVKTLKTLMTEHSLPLWSGEGLDAAACGFVEKLDISRAGPIRRHRRVFASRRDRSKAISIDYAVMGKTSHAAVVPVACGWSDVGSWHAVWELSGKDEQGNAAQGTAVFEDSRNCNVSTDKALVALEGVDDLVVVATQDAVLVSRQKDANGLKRLVAKLKTVAPQVTEDHLKVHRPWGSCQSMDTGDRHQVKRIVVKPGARLSLQKHHHRSEHWIVVRGTARVTVNELVKIVHENESIYIPIGAVHRLENPGKILLELIEVQTGSYLGEDDIIRIEDDYQRS
jgi:mannose-1-phosphate guanylyltransferase / mannose-6-phosphate isomerase